jgi:hypothetical protein
LEELVMSKVDWNEELGDADGVVAISQRKGKVRAKFEGEVQLIFENLFDDDPEKPYEN